MTSKRKRTNFCVNKRRGDDWRHSTLGSGCLRTQRRGYVQTDDNENLLCSVIVCNPLPPPHQTSVALSQESRATTLLALGNGGDLKLAPKKTDLGTVPRIGLGLALGLVVGPGLGRDDQGQAAV